MRSPTKNTALPTDRSLSFKSGRSGSKIGPYSNDEANAGPINVRCEGRCDGCFDLGQWVRFAQKIVKDRPLEGRHPQLCSPRTGRMRRMVLNTRLPLEMHINC